MDCPGFLCRKHTITTCMDQPLPKVDVVCVPPPASGPHSDDYTVLMWARMEPDKLLCAFDARRGTFRQGASPFPTGRACASVIINQGERKRLWVSALVSINGCGHFLIYHGTLSLAILLLLFLEQLCGADLLSRPGN